MSCLIVFWRIQVKHCKTRSRMSTWETYWETSMNYWGGQGVTLIQRSAQIDSMFVHWKNHVTCECCIVKSSRNTTNIYKQYYYNLLQEYYQCYQSFFFPTCAGMKFTTINPISLGQGNLETGDGDICWSISGLFLERVDGWWGDSWMYPYQCTPMGNPYISPI